MTMPEVVEIASPGGVTIVEVAVPGLQGPAGPQGPPGPSGTLAYEHIQAVAGNEWIVNHNLGLKPAVTVFDAAAAQVLAEVVHISVNQARIFFATPQSGTARCV